MIVSNVQRYMVVSADTHAGASVEGYRPYLEKRWLGEFDAWAAAYHDAWLDTDDGPMKMGVASGGDDVNWDSQKRAQELEGQGIVGEVIFPNTSPPFFPSAVLSARNPRSRTEYERRVAGLRAHNRWLVDFCADWPGRRAGIAQIFLNDVDDAVAELEWARGAGLTGGVLLPVVTPADGLPELYSTEYDRLYAACADLEVPITQHSHAPGAPTEAGMAIGFVELQFWSQRGLSHLIVGGVFERHPSLKFVIAEQFCGWVPQQMAALDVAYEQPTTPGSMANKFCGPAFDVLSKPPSEYWTQNCYSGSFIHPTEMLIREQIGVNKIMWGADYPHSEGSTPLSREAMRAVFADVPVDETRQMLGETAARLYGLDAHVLRAAADRVGPLVEDVHPRLDVWPDYPNETQCVTFADPGGVPTVPQL